MGRTFGAMQYNRPAERIDQDSSRERERGGGGGGERKMKRQKK